MPEYSQENIRVNFEIDLPAGKIEKAQIGVVKFYGNISKWVPSLHFPSYQEMEAFGRQLCNRLDPLQDSNVYFYPGDGAVVYLPNAASTMPTNKVTYLYRTTASESGPFSSFRVKCTE